ncbi:MULTISPECIES: universal stress protein [Isoptericola]|uniref:Universal stress protein n=1 Tax=Isoptericola haloaureus TaxID=1542902 RepID=A0ABU7Z725_9MICO|nr:universal stress protein [Isoptericola sp. AK164]
MAIVVGHLSTPEGAKALAAAEAEAAQRGTRLVVIGSGNGVEEVVQRLEAAGVEHAVVPGTGDLAEDLVREAVEARAELIVIGLRRRSPVGKLILGSGAQRILLEAPCPVLAVKP